MSCPFGTTEFNPLSVKKMLQFNELVAQLKVHFTLLPDGRPGFNKSYKIQDAALSAFAVFFTQCPSFLANQTKMQETHGENNATSLFQVTNIPSDNQTRNLLDPIAPSHLTPLYELVFKNLLAGGFIEPYRSINNSILIALDGVCYHSSSAISCDKCRTQEHKNGKITFTHTVITPVIVAPENPHVVSLPPEFITPQDGHEKQDSGAPRGAHKPEVKVLTRKRNPPHLGLSFGLVEVTT